MDSIKESDRKLIRQYTDVLPPNSSGYRLKMLTQMISRKFQDQLDPYGVTVLQWFILACLWQEDGLATSTITIRLNQLGGTMTDVLKGLERRALISRSRDPQDRRVTRIWLTEAGAKLQQDLLPLARRLQEGVYACLTADEYSSFSKTLDKLTAHLL
jgi:MarR family transcriptional regulator, organic hydroperoxide resistance regulator